MPPSRSQKKHGTVPRYRCAVLATPGGNDASTDRFRLHRLDFAALEAG